MNVFFTSPFSFEKDFGKAYNQYMDLVADPEDWVCFTDLDVCFLTPDIGFQVKELIDMYPDTGLFSCLTNRVGNPNQCLNGIINEDPNILNHRRIAAQLSKDCRMEVRECGEPLSGMMMVIKKATWLKIHGAPEGRGLLTVDTHIGQRVLNAGLKIRIAQGIYVFHFYRLDTGRHDKSHLLVMKPVDPSNPQSPQVSITKKKRARFL